MARSADASSRRLVVHLTAIGIALSAALFGGVYSARLPLWESPDEPARAAEAYAIAGRSIEASGPKLPSLAAADPPLYAWIESVAVRLVGATELPIVRPNPDFLVTRVGGRSEEAVLHGQDEVSPWPRDVAELHAVRLLSSVWAVVAVMSTYGVGRRLFQPRAAAVCLAAMLAWLPSFLFAVSAMEPLSLAAAMGALCLYGCVHIARGGRRAMAAIIAGGAGGLAALASTAGLCLVAPIAAALVLQTVVAKEAADEPVDVTPRKATGWANSALAAATWVVGGGWWYLGRLPMGLPGIFLPGSDPSLAASINNEAGRTPLFSFGMHPLFQTFVGRFGWLTTRAPAEVYGAATLVLLLAGLGVVAMSISWISVRSVLTRRDAGTWTLCVVATASGLAVVTIPATIWPGRFGVDGRGLLVVGPACLALIVAGLRACAGRRLAWLTLIVPPLLLAASIVSLPQLATPRYRFDRLWETPPLASMTASGHVTYVGAATLYGYRVDSNVVQSGRSIDVALFWRRATTQPRGFQSFVHVATPDGHPVAQKDQEPGAGWYPPELWQRRDVVEDVHHTEIATSVAPGRYVVIAGAYDLASGVRYRATDASWPIIADAVVLGDVTVRD